MPDVRVARNGRTVPDMFLRLLRTVVPRQCLSLKAQSARDAKELHDLVKAVSENLISSKQTVKNIPIDQPLQLSMENSKVAKRF